DKIDLGQDIGTDGLIRDDFVLVVRERCANGNNDHSHCRRDICRRENGLLDTAEPGAEKSQ
ncbi:hypothetical protein, partial [Mesorhizobium sp.]|uniref:hypothetical protein n=1 Tax=Mesorhizobium sp. TaxID=1871066 RepID=UPI0025F4E579